MPGGTLVVATLGFHEHFAIRRLNSLGAGGGDYVAAVTVKPPAAAVRAAWGSLASIATRLGVKPLGLYELDPSDFEGAVAGLLEWLDSTASGAGVERIVVEATGGARILTVASLIAVIPLTARYKVEYYVQSDTGELWQAKIPGDLVKLILKPPTPKRLAILQAVLQEPGSTPARIAEKTGMHPKTLINNLAALKKQGLLTQKGRNRGLYPTSRTKLAIHLAKAHAQIKP